MKIKLILLALVTLFIGEWGFCCTTFVLKGPDGKNFIWKKPDFPVGKDISTSITGIW